MKINNVKIKAVKFAFDGCHKIYILERNAQEIKAIKLGYEIKGMESIATTYNKSCELKFIRFWDMRKKKPIVSQEESNRLYKIAHKQYSLK